jgi:hypothetical protein
MFSNTSARRPSSPGHQAGAPLRHPVDVRRSVARYPGGHQAGVARPPCGQNDSVQSFPRPSGRGSIAAPLATAGAAAYLPPAIRPGLHCRRLRCRAGHGLPPAIRPGLHCGVDMRARARRRHQGCRFPRPSGRGSIAADSSYADDSCTASEWTSTGTTCPGELNFPRPSGRGSIAAIRRMRSGRASRWPSPGLHCSVDDFLPPAIRPGLHCGDPPTGHRRVPGLPAAIRPGLHCGSEGAGTSPSGLGGTSPGHQAPGLHCGFPRPSGRGSIAAARPAYTPRRASPGHQAGAPLRRRLGALT